MAAIEISEKNGLFSIELDECEWRELIVDNESIQKSYDGRRNYHQQTPGMLQFQAKARGLDISNPDNNLILKGFNEKDCTCVISYTVRNGYQVLNGCLTSFK